MGPPAAAPAPATPASVGSPSQPIQLSDLQSILATMNAATIATPSAGTTAGLHGMFEVRAWRKTSSRRYEIDTLVPNNDIDFNFLKNFVLNVCFIHWS